MRIITSVVFLCMIGFMPLAQADEIKECGTYEMEGHIVVKNGKAEFLINRFSHSEIRVRLNVKNNLSEYHNKPVKVQVKILRECQFECDSDQIKVLGYLDPFMVPQNPFFPRQKPILPKKCL